MNTCHVYAALREYEEVEDPYTSPYGSVHSSVADRKIIGPRQLGGRVPGQPPLDPLVQFIVT